MAQTQAPTKVHGDPRREGSRWINRPPTAEELGKWFEKNVRIDELLSHKHYLPGITLIPNKEWFDHVEGDELKKRLQFVYTPYPKVETRELYFWDYCDANGYLGEIEQLQARHRGDLPDGFFTMPVSDGQGKVTTFVGASYQVRIWKPDVRAGGKGRPVRIPPAGTKIVPLLRRGYNSVLVPDENALAKAQTGAIGRALGYAGMLVVPGAGIATAEDMHEFVSGETTIDPRLAEETPALPPTHFEAGAATTLQESVQRLRSQLESEHPSAYEEAVAWCQEKGYSITEPPDTALRGLERQLRRKLNQAETEK